MASAGPSSDVTGAPDGDRTASKVSSDVGAPDAGRAATAGASAALAAAAGGASFSAPVDEAALDKLMERALAAHKSGRASFAAALWGRAVAAATEMYGETLAVVKCTLMQASCVAAQASASTSDEFAALEAESWELASSVLPLLSTRMDANTLLPGRCTKAEVEFHKRFELVKSRVDASPPWSARDLQLVSFGVGYKAAMVAATHALCRSLTQPRPHDAPRLMAFVLRAVDMVRALTHSWKRQRVHDASLRRCFLLHAVLGRSHFLKKRRLHMIAQDTCAFTMQIRSLLRFVTDGLQQRWWP